MRLFTAIDLPEEIVPAVERLQSSFRLRANIQWSPKKNLHITTKFIGEWPDSRLDELDERLKRLQKAGPIEIALRDLGWFPNANVPKVFWVGAEGGAALHKLAECTQAALEEIGVAKDAHIYRPHLTLAKIKQGQAMEHLQQAVKQIQPVRVGSFRAISFCLFESKIFEGESTYTALQTYSI